MSEYLLPKVSVKAAEEVRATNPFLRQIGTDERFIYLKRISEKIQAENPYAYALVLGTEMLNLPQERRMPFWSGSVTCYDALSKESQLPTVDRHTAAYMLVQLRTVGYNPKGRFVQVVAKNTELAGLLFALGEDGLRGAMLTHDLLEQQAKFDKGLQRPNITLEDSVN